MTSSSDAVDVAIVGGGAAGLNAALVLGRARRSVAVIDAGEPRNRFAAHMNGFLSRDGVPPSTLLEIGRTEIAGYGATIIPSTALSLTGSAGTGFELELASGSVLRARRVLVATGLSDGLPPIPGLAAHWGSAVVACPYCDGYEVRDQPIGVLVSTPMDAHKALLLTQWSADVTLFLHESIADDLDPDLAARLSRVGAVVHPGSVTRIDAAPDSGIMVRLADGTSVARRTLFISPRLVPQDALLRSAGAAVTETPVGTFVAVDLMGATSVPGLYGAGNVVDPMAQVINAAAAGAKAGAAINGDLVLADTAA